jgi:hypothetical protein
MVNFAIIADNKVVNVAVSNSPLADNWIESQTAAIGDDYDPETGEFTRPDPVVVVPESVSALAGLLVIDGAGLSAAYEAWAKSEDRTFAEKAFSDKALTWKRNDPVLISGATALGLTEDQLDQLFIAAAQG